jgi:hypothetical protein
MFLDYYRPSVTLTRTSAWISSYINENGTHEITRTPGTGYYANNKDESFGGTIGIEGSPLYEETRITYYGDFKCVHKYGVRLNSYYEEVSFSGRQYYFRDKELPDSPDEAVLVWSGEYLFWFDIKGNLISYINM